MHDCATCLNTKECCCKNCFKDEEFKIFESLTKEELDYLIDQKQQIQYKQGETIIKQNTASTYVICVRDGIAKVYVEGLNGKNIILNLIGKQDFITGGGLFNGNVQHMTISAITPVVCCLIDSAKLVNVFSENKQFAIEILRHHTKQNNELLSKLVNLTQKYMPGRVADTLLYLKNDVCKSNTEFSVPLNRTDLAEMSNMTKESFVRILHEFKLSGHIETHGNKFEILDENALISISKNG